MPTNWQRQKVDCAGEKVYRYLMVCRRCAHFKLTTRKGHGQCSATGNSTHRQTLSCDKFEVSDETELLLESAVIDGDFKKLTIDGHIYYLTQAEVDSIVDMLLEF